MNISQNSVLTTMQENNPIVKHKHICPHHIVYLYIAKAASERKLNMCNWAGQRLLYDKLNTNALDVFQ